MTTPAQTPHRSKQDYVTPVNFIEAVKRRLGIERFAFDFAADHVNAKAEHYFDIAQNALDPKHDWAAQVGSIGWGWLNPPFGDIRPWAARCWEMRTRGHVVLLVPAAVGANWYKDYVHGFADVLLLNGRIAFMPDRPTWGYPKDCILARFGPDVEPGYEIWHWGGGR